MKTVGVAILSLNLAACATTDALGITRSVVEQQVDGTFIERREPEPGAWAVAVGAADGLLPGIGGALVGLGGLALSWLTRRKLADMRNVAASVVNAVESVGAAAAPIKAAMAMKTREGDKTRTIIREIKNGSANK